VHGFWKISSRTSQEELSKLEAVELTDFGGRACKPIIAFRLLRPAVSSNIGMLRRFRWRTDEMNGALGALLGDVDCATLGEYDPRRSIAETRTYRRSPRGLCS